MASTRDWSRLHDQGKLNAVQESFFQPKPVEQLFDCNADALVMVDPVLYEAAVAAVANACDQLRSRYGTRADLLAVDVDALTIELAEASEDSSRLAGVGIGLRLVCEAALAHRFMELSG